MPNAINLIHNIERQLLWWAGQQSYLEIQNGDRWENVLAANIKSNNPYR